MPQWNETTVAFDFETSGTLPEYALQPWRAATGEFWATSFVWAWRDGTRIEVDGGLNPDRRMMKRFLHKLITEKRRGLGWNTLFDLSVLQAYDLDDLVQECKWLDGMLLYRHLEVEPEYEMDRSKKRSFGLKPAVEVYMPEHAGYADEVDYHSTDPEERRKLHEYNIRDNVFTLRIARKVWGALTSQQQRAALIEAESLPLVSLANLRGMIIDTIACKELEQRLTHTADDAIARLQWFGVTEKIVRSPTKLATLMFENWRLPVLKTNVGKKSGKITRSTDKEVLHELSFTDPKVKLLRTYREALNNRTKFATAPLKAVAYNGDGKAHPQGRVFGTYSGRMTYSSKQGRNKDEKPIGWAIHQEKRGADFRSILIPPYGCALMEFDASGQEYRWMAIASGDRTMMQLCLPGEDPHGFMGARVTEQDYRNLQALVKGGDPKAKDTRQLGKVGNLSLQYRTSARKLMSVARVQYEIPMLLPEAQRVHAVYPRTYSEVPRYWTKQISVTKRLGYVETFAGRRVNVTGDWSGRMGWSMGSTAINYRIQGTGADQKYLALMCIKDYITSIRAQFALDMHDGLYFYVPIPKVQEAARTIKPILDSLPYKQAWGLTPPIPLPWDCKVGPSWGGLKDFKFD